ncbi:lipopolysaccharide heptosyltransferase family protein [Rhodanobacter glycinis]|uniref:Lipopolysaccharide heptosyltransferase family protein n=1 Tax=Rhodanobacter glycinis TaxID=582702 RepID=A0A502CEE2_9GAMM|nr:glycosyltransferase family 9 protein [Rhodanobacter glycinis]TPG10156.1 lipopolysaccharide heptosyltransferase family protein [Rhodanobacter glycinis]TPG50933.1 lipopolysaccharide heptosyltransferase family protein [Rhodanobacter glycinis]
MTTPATICLLRTSAIGDVTHVVPLVRTLQQAWPDTALTWIVGKLERKLVGDLPGVEFVTFDKAAGWAGMRAVHAALRRQRFDALLQMQVAMRSNLLSLGIKAERRVGYDRARSKDLHGLVINERIPARSGEHVLDAIGSFCEPLGLKQTQVRWDIPIPDEAHAWAAEQLPGDKPTLLVSPTSSHALRNWRPERYAAVMDHVAARGWRVALVGGPSPDERAMADSVLAQCRRAPFDLTGKDTLKKLLALLSRAQLLLTPDSGPMHMANAVGAKVLGLHAASNPDRSGPYSDRRWCVNKYDEAARKYLGKPASEIPWGSKIEKPGVMDLIGVDEVIECYEAAAHELNLP